MTRRLASRRRLAELERFIGLDPSDDLPDPVTTGPPCSKCGEPTAEPHNICVNTDCDRFGGVRRRTGPAAMLVTILCTMIAWGDAAVHGAIVAAVFMLVLLWLEIGMLFEKQKGR